MGCSGSMSWSRRGCRVFSEAGGVNYVGLAAGRGKRLNPLTNVHQKCMLQFHGKPFLEYTLAEVAKVFDHERDTLTLVVGYLEEQVRGYFGTTWEGLPINYVTQTPQCGTGHALYVAHSALRFNGPVVAWLGDCFFSADVLVAVRDAEGDALTYVDLADTEEAAASPLKVSDNHVEKLTWGFAEDEEFGNAADIGLWRLETETLDLLPAVNERGEWRLLRGLARRMEEGHVVAAIRANEWIHLGNVPRTLDRMQSVSKRLMKTCE